MTTSIASTLAVVHSDDYAGWVFNSLHPTQGRRFVNAMARLRELAPAAGVDLLDIDSDLLLGAETLALVHDPDYVEQVIIEGLSGEWSGSRPDLGRIAQRMAGGTLLAAQVLVAGGALTAVHFAGAKHHAMRDHSSGFCVFNDFALTAKMLLDDPTNWIDRICILDIDAHHGDGVEALLQSDSRVQTFSVHDSTIFPGTGREDTPASHVFNRPLPSEAGDRELSECIRDFVEAAHFFDPEMIMIAMGADGHAADPLSSLQYSVEGMARGVRHVRRAFPTTPILLGGAGGYQPDTITPEAWARMTLAAAQPVEDKLFTGCVTQIPWEISAVEVSNDEPG